MTASSFLSAWEARAQRGRAAPPDSALQHARRSWFDTAAATVGGAREPCTAAALQSCLLLDPAMPLRPCDDALLLGAIGQRLPDPSASESIPA